MSLVIIVCGLPGSGKSFFAEKLAKALHAEYSNSDIIRMQLIKQRNYTFEEKEKVYKELLKTMENAINDNKSIVLDATFYRRSLRNRFITKAKELKTSIHFIEIQATSEISKRRLSKQRKHSEADYEVYLIIEKLFQPLENEHLTLHSNDHNIDEMINKAIQYVS